MPLQPTSPPAVEPVSLARVKAHLRLDGDDEDELLASLLAAARTHVERSLGLALITQGWSYFLDRWPAAPWVELPLAPAREVTSVTTFAADHEGAVLDPDSYWLDAVSRPARLVARGTRPWPMPGRRANGIEIAFAAGHGDGAEDVPAPLRQALLLLVAHWYERREPVVLGTAPLDVPLAVAAILHPYRGARL